MKKEELSEIIDLLLKNGSIDSDKIPDIALYMDQILTFFDDKLSFIARKDEGKVLTKTMINNYSKDKLLPPSVNKKYSKEHMLLLAMIVQMKGVLTISDIDRLLKIIQQNPGVSEFYETFKNKQDESVKKLYSALPVDCEEHNNSYTLDLIFSLIIDANIKKILAEKLIDSLL